MSLLVLALMAVLPLQDEAVRAMGDRQGCVVALDARNGHLLAMVHPTVAARAYPVGSLAKLVTALAAVEAHVTDPDRTLECRGGRGPFHCWGLHGRVRLAEAIAQSCAFYFFTVGQELGGSRLVRALHAAGFGQATGMALRGEEAGVVVPPRSPEEVMTMAYGDTPALQATPLQIAVLAGALARDGRRYRPTWGGPRVCLGTLPFPHAVEAVRQGMRLAVQAGSARSAEVPRLHVFGTTGTATWPEDPSRRHGWFAGYAGDVALAVYMHDGSGYRDAGPVARAVFEAAP